ncbi:MAG: aldo/keto reductase, partial [Thermobifida sp.]|nr:aldo/keto reductase [Thermobifida sp.]
EREHVEAVRTIATVTPHVLQVESHPFFPNADLRAYAQGLGMVFEAWSPLARGRAVTDPTLVEIGAELGVGPTQVALRWALDRGHVVFPKTLSRERMAANFDVFSFLLDPEQTARIDALDAGEAGRMGSHPATMDRL